MHQKNAPVYDYDFITEQRLKGVNWRKLGTYYNKSHTTVMRWYRDEGKRKTKIRTFKKTKGKPRKGIPKGGLTRGLRRRHRVPYGQIEPTFYRVEAKTVDDIMDWAKLYTPYDWDNKNIRENIEFMYFEIYKNKNKGLMGKPRDSGKSKSSVIVYAFIFANDYNTQMSIVNGSKAKNRIFNGMMRIFTGRKFREDYGDIVESKNKTTGEIELYLELRELSNEISDDPSFLVTGWSGIIGSHPFIVWLEDILQSEFISESSNEYLIEEVHDNIIDKLSDIRGGTFTRKGTKDFYSKLPMQGYRMYTRKAIYLLKGRFPDRSDIIWKTVTSGDDTQEIPIDIKIPKGSKYRIIERPGWTIKSLLIKRAMNPKSFEREMQNNPMIIEGDYFKKSQFDKVPAFKAQGMAYYVYCDPAYGKTTAADYTAIIVVTTYKGIMYVVDGLLQQGLTFNSIKQEIKNMAIKWGAQYSALRKDFAEVWLKQELEYQLPIKPITDNTNKMDRIEALDIPLEDRKIKFFDNAGGVDQGIQQCLEYDRKKSTAIKKDDYPDILSTAYTDMKHKLYILKSVISTF